MDVFQTQSRFTVLFIHALSALFRVTQNQTTADSGRSPSGIYTIKARITMSTAATEDGPGPVHDTTQTNPPKSKKQDFWHNLGYQLFQATD